MNAILQYLAAKPLITLLICLGAGFLLGKIKMGRFPNNATLGTIVAAIALNLLIRGADLALDGKTYDLLRNLFFAMFTFSLGYSAGPGFVNAWRRSGYKAVLSQVALCCFYCACVLGVMVVIARIPLLSDVGSVNGLLAGAQTQSSILADGLSSGQMVAYAVSYVVGTLMMILFVQRMAPAMLKTPLRQAVKRYIDRLGGAGETAEQVIPARLVQLRAYRVLPAAALVGKTVDQIETAAAHRLEIVSLFREEKALEGLNQQTAVQAGDVLVVVGDVRTIRDVPGDLVEEEADERYLTAELRHADIVITEDGAGLPGDLNHLGVLLLSVLRRGKLLSPQQAGAIARDDIIHVAGLSRGVGEIAKKYGYIKENGAASDIPVMMLALAAAIVVGGIAVGGVSLGSGCCAILAGILCGVINQRQPRKAYVPAATLAFVRTLGLNLFIAAVTLSSAMDPEQIFSLNTLLVMALAAAVSLIPLLLGFFFGRRVLKMDPVELLGGLCGSGTCTAALNALEEETESTAFTASYTPAYVAGNILLTLTGTLLLRILGV